MTVDQLVAKIKVSPALAQNFRREGYYICPHCIKRIVEFPDQRAVETVINTITECEKHASELQQQVRQVTRGLQEDLNQIHEKSRQAEIYFDRGSELKRRGRCGRAKGS